MIISNLNDVTIDKENDQERGLKSILKWYRIFVTKPWARRPPGFQLSLMPVLGNEETIELQSYVVWSTELPYPFNFCRGENRLNFLEFNDSCVSGSVPQG